MIIGFIGFGKVASNLVKLINSDEITFITSCENRSVETVDRIRKSKVEIFDSFREVALKSDILISTTSPKSALEVSEYGKYCGGIYLDLNNISPKTTKSIAKNLKKFVDGSIIGKIDSSNPVLYLSGKYSDELLFLNDFLTVKKISDNVGDASTLKLLRSTYTKTLSAVLIESFRLSEKFDLEDEFFETLSLTEGNEFKKNSLSRINNTLNASKRKSEELEEILEYFGDDLIMVNAAYNVIKQ